MRVFERLVVQQPAVDAQELVNVVLVLAPFWRKLLIFLNFSAIFNMGERPFEVLVIIRWPRQRVGREP